MPSRSGQLWPESDKHEFPAKPANSLEPENRIESGNYVDIDEFSVLAAIRENIFLYPHHCSTIYLRTTSTIALHNND
jgi:hypothetical protein